MISKHKGKLFFLSLFLVFNIFLFVTHKTYFYTAVYHNYADIDDYTFFENRIITKSTNHQPWKLGLNYNKKPLSIGFRKTLEEIETVSFLIIKSGEIQYEEYWDGYSETSYSNSFSIAKSIISLLIGIAIDEGEIKSANDPIGNYLPYYSSKEFSGITIKHLLTMSSGLNWEESYGSPFSMTTEAYYGDDLKRLMFELKPLRKPGIRWRYKSGDTQLLGLILKQATEIPVGEYASQKLWKPLGAENDALWSLDKKNGVEKMYCCFNSNARDFARIGQLVLQDGGWNGEQIVSKEYLEASIKPCMMLDADAENVKHYGFKWWLIPEYKGFNIYYARGILGQYIINIPEKDVVVVRLGKQRGEKIGAHPAEVFSIIDEVVNNY